MVFDFEVEENIDNIPRKLRTRDGKEILIPDYPLGTKDQNWRRKQGFNKGKRHPKPTPQPKGK